MLARLSRVIALFAAVQILGGHWLALQSVAWIGMVADYSRGETLAVALEKTFDGEHPCVLCKVVKSGREQQQQQEVSKLIVKVEATLAPALRLPPPAASPWQYALRPSLETQRSHAPPTPPPLVS